MKNIITISLEKFLVSRLIEMDKRYQDRFESQEKALVVALDSLGRRLDSLNEFRQQLNDQAASFLSRNEYFTAHQALIDKIDSLTLRVAATEGESKGSQLTKGNFFAGIGAIGAILGIIVLLANHVFK